MDLLYVGTLPPHAGAAALLAGKILAGLSHRGHRVRALSSRDSDDHGDLYGRAHPGIEVSRYSVPGRNLGPLAWHEPGYRRAEQAVIGRDLNRLLDERRPDIILLGREQYLWNVPQVVSPRNIPTVVVLHGSGVLEVMLNRLGDTFTTEFFEHARQVTHMIAVADHYRLYMEGLGYTNVHHIPNGIDTAQFAPAVRAPGVVARDGNSAGRDHRAACL